MDSIQEIKKLLRLQSLEEICLELCDPLIHPEVDLKIFGNKKSLIIKNKTLANYKLNKKFKAKIIANEFEGEITNIGIYVNKKEFVYFDIKNLKRSSSFSQMDQKNIKSCMYSQFLADRIHDYLIQLNVVSIKSFIDKTLLDQVIEYKNLKKTIFRLKNEQKSFINKS